MDQQILHWIPLILAVTLAIVTLFWSRPVKKERRSCGQRIIFLLYKAARWSWAVARAVDTGYLEYCRVITDTPFEIENEKVFGNRIKPMAKETNSPQALNWEAFEKSA